jgi:hypothetical protein
MMKIIMVIQVNDSKFIVKMTAPKPYTRKSIKPRQAHKLATRYQRNSKHRDTYEN